MENSITDALNAYARELAEARFTHDRLKAELALKRAEWETENAALIAREKNSKQSLADLESQVREEVADMYNETGEKKLHAALTAYDKDVIEIDEERARSWAVAKGLVNLLAINKSQFKKAIQSGVVDDPACYDRYKVAAARIATDLSAYLSDQPD